jgi:hypothetical protein
MPKPNPSDEFDVAQAQPTDVKRTENAQQKTKAGSVKALAPAAPKFNPAEDHIPPALDARTLRETWARQNEAMRDMRLERLAHENQDVRWLMDQLAEVKLKLAKLENQT